MAVRDVNSDGAADYVPYEAVTDPQRMLWNVIMGYRDSNTNVFRPGMRIQLREVSEAVSIIKKRDPILLIAVGMLSILTLKALGIPTEEIIHYLITAIPKLLGGVTL